MIKQITLKNWKSFGEATLYVDPLTVIVGTNASGKSNLIEALLFLNRISISLIGEALVPIIPYIRGGKESLCKKPFTYFTLVTLIEKDDIEYEYMLEIELDTRDNSIYNGKFYFKNLTNIELNSLSYSETYRTTVYEVLSKICVLAPNPNKMRDYSKVSEELLDDASNIAGVLASLPHDKKTDFENTLTGYVKELPQTDIKKVWAEKVGRLGSDAMLYCEEKWDNTQDGEGEIIDAKSMSDGTLRYIAIVTALLTKPEGTTLVIDEVDTGLHPSRAKILINTLRGLGAKRNIDVIITTHNPAILDAVGVQMLPFITVAHRDVNDGSSKLTLLEDVDHIAKLIAGGTLGDILTEGKIEESLESEETNG